MSNIPYNYMELFPCIFPGNISTYLEAILALSQKEVQARYRKKLKDGKLRRIELIIDKDTDRMIEYLTHSLGATRKGAIVQAVRALYKQQREFDDDERGPLMPGFSRF